MRKMSEINAIGNPLPHFGLPGDKIIESLVDFSLNMIIKQK
mgnify:CR=1 FL=1